MPALSLLPLAALFIAIAPAAATFGKNVVPYIPQVLQSHPLMSIPWVMLINLLVIFLQLERPNRPTSKPHDRPMRLHKHPVEQGKCPRVCGVVISPTSHVLIHSFTGLTQLRPTDCSYSPRMLSPRLISSMVRSSFPDPRPCRSPSMQEVTSSS